MLELLADPTVAVELREVESVNREGAERFLEKQASVALFAPKTCVDLAVERSEDGKLIGLVSVVSNGHRQAEIGWAFHSEHRGQGYATEAARGLLDLLFRTHGFHRVFAGTIYTNERSWKVMERLGMRKEAHFWKAHVPAEEGGEWIDTVRYGLLAEEWPTQEFG